MFSCRSFTTNTVLVLQYALDMLHCLEELHVTGLVSLQSEA